MKQPLFVQSKSNGVIGAALLSMALSVLPAAHASVYQVTMGTGALAGTQAQLAFDFIDGGAPSQSLVISHFAGNATLGAQTATGGVTGSLPGSVTLSDAEFFNELLAGVTLGSTLSFRFEPAAGHPAALSVPDAFTFLLLDATGTAPLFDTTDASGGSALLRFDIDGSAAGGLNVFAAAQQRVSISVTALLPAVPEPATGWMLGLGLMAMNLGRRRLAGQGERP
jgi:hypothetical protein